MAWDYFSFTTRILDKTHGRYIASRWPGKPCTKTVISSVFCISKIQIQHLKSLALRVFFCWSRIISDGNGSTQRQMDHFNGLGWFVLLVSVLLDVPYQDHWQKLLMLNLQIHCNWMWNRKQFIFCCINAIFGHFHVLLHKAFVIGIHVFNQHQLLENKKTICV